MKQIIIAAILLILGAFLGRVVGAGAADQAEVYQCQKRLMELGYDSGPLDGIWGNKTVAALKEFQEDNNLPITGFLDDKTKIKLGFPDLQEKVKPDTASKNEVDRFLDDFEETHRQLIFSYDSYKRYEQDAYLAGVYISEENYRLAVIKWEKMYSELASKAQRARYSLILERLNNDIDRIKKEIELQ